MDEAKKQGIDLLMENLNIIVSYDPTSLSEGKDLGAINFRSGKPLFEQTIELAKEFRALPLDILPIETLKALVAPIKTLAEGLKQIAEFTLVGQPNPEGQRNSLLTQAQRYHDQAFTAITPHLAYLSLKSAQVQETMRRSAELLKDTEQKVSNVFKEIEHKRKDVDAIVQAARDAASKIGVAQFATKFEELAAEHNDLSKKWLVATGLLGVMTILVAVIFLIIIPPIGNMSELSTIQRIITKLVVISIFYYSALWAAKNYRAHRHLSVVNKHRQSALSTFETFVSAAADLQTKNAVLLEATHCIFSPAVSGYLGADEENPSNRIIEVLKTFSSTPPNK